MAHEQGEQGDLFALLAQLLGHLERDEGAHAVAADAVGTRGLDASQRLEVVRGHGLDRAMGRLTVQAARLEREEGLVRPEAARQVAIEEDLARMAVNPEEGRA